MHSKEKKFSNSQNIYLVGLMGTGKSTVGKILAEKLGMDFVDSDEAIEKKAAMSVSEIFARHGEGFFRNLEKEFIQTGHAQQNQVVACGGGLCVPPGMMEAIKEKGWVVCLWAEPETLLLRTGKNQDRPLLQTAKPLEVLQKLHQQRAARYREADQTVETDQLSPQEIADQVAGLAG